MVNFSLTTTDSCSKTIVLQSAKRSKVVRGAFLEFEIEITLILVFTLIAQITVVVQQ